MAEEEKKPAPIDLPDLKKQEKERKKAGVAFQGGVAGGSPFTGATGGSGAGGAAGSAGSAASGAARAAAAAARAGTAGVPGATGLSGEISGGLLSRLAQVLARATATWAGKAAVMASVAVVMGGAIVVMKAMNAGAPQAGGPDLGGLSSSISVDRGGGNTALDYAARAARGLALNKGPAAGKAGPAATAPGAAKDAPPAGAAAKADGNFESRPGEGANKDLMENNLAGAKLSSSLGGGTFGGKDVFGRPESPSKFGEAMRGGLSRLGFASIDKGRSSRMTKSQAKGSRTVALGRHGPKSSKALGQLRGMSTLNSAMRAGGTGAGEAQSAAATTQFEGVEPVGGAAPTSPVDSTIPANLPGNTPTSGGSVPNDISGACTQSQIDAGMISDGTSCVELPNTNYDNATPWQGLVDTSNGLLIAAGVMMTIAGILGVIGRSEIEAGTPLLASTCTAAAGAAMIAMGTLLQTIAIVLAAIAAIISLIVVVLGGIMQNMGAGTQGTIFMVAGGIAAIFSLLSAFSVVGPVASIVGGVVMMFAGILGALLG